MEIRGEYVSPAADAAAAEQTAGKERPARAENAANAGAAGKAIPDAGAAPARQEAAIFAALESFGLNPTAENMKLAALLLENGMPLGKDAMQALNRALKLMGGEITPENVRKAMFLLENGIPINQKNVQALTALVDGQAKLAGRLAELIDSLNAMPPSPEKDAVFKALSTSVGANIAADTAAEGEAAVIKQIVEETVGQVKQAAVIEQAAAERPLNTAAQTKATEEAAITRAFQNDGLPPGAFTQLKEELIARFPDSRELIERLAGEKNDFARFVESNAPQLREAVERLLSENGLTREALSDVVSKLRGGQPEGEGAPKAALTRGEIEFIISRFIENGGDAEAVRRVFPDPRGEVRHDAAALRKMLSYAFEEGSPKELEKFLSGLKQGVQTAREAAQNAETPEAARFIRNADAMLDNMTFTAQARNMLYAQMPVRMADDSANGELFVFRDKKRRSAGSGEKSSALIALDTLNLGRFETYVQKDGKTVACAFRLADERVAELVRTNIHRLEALLTDHGYSLNAYSFQKQEEPFTVLEREPYGDETTHTAQAGGFVFDMRT